MIWNQEGRVTQRPKIELKSRVGEIEQIRTQRIKDQRIIQRTERRYGAGLGREFLFGGSVLTERLYIT